jgi:hypothetical protein
VSAYVEAGADLVTPSMVPLEQISEVASRIGAGATTWGIGSHSAEELNVEGHAMTLYAMQSTLVAYRAVRDFLEGLAGSGESLPPDQFMGLVGELMALQGGPATSRSRRGSHPRTSPSSIARSRHSGLGWTYLRGVSDAGRHPNDSAFADATNGAG